MVNIVVFLWEGFFFVLHIKISPDLEVFVESILKSISQLYVVVMGVEHLISIGSSNLLVALVDEEVVGISE